MSSSISGRTRTPPDLKWLLNERAAIAGRIQKLEKVLHGLHKMEQSLSECRGTLDALDTAIGLAYQGVRPDAAGTVNAWAGKYGQLGALTEFVVQLLREAAPAPVNARDVAFKVAEHFEIQLLCSADQLALRVSVKNTFKRLYQSGKVVPLHSRARLGGNQPGIWRWKQPIPTLSDLAAKAQRMAQAAAEASDVSRKPAKSSASAG